MLFALLGRFLWKVSFGASGFACLPALPPFRSPLRLHTQFFLRLFWYLNLLFLALVFFFFIFIFLFTSVCSHQPPAHHFSLSTAGAERFSPPFLCRQFFSPLVLGFHAEAILCPPVTAPLDASPLFLPLARCPFSSVPPGPPPSFVPSFRFSLSQGYSLLFPPPFSLCSLSVDFVFLLGTCSDRSFCVLFPLFTFFLFVVSRAIFFSFDIHSLSR